MALSFSHLSGSLFVTGSVSASLGFSGSIDYDEGRIDHDLLFNYSASRHVDHAAVSINTGTGLTGGGTLETTRTITFDGAGTQVVSGSAQVLTLTSGSSIVSSSILTAPSTQGQVQNSINGNDTAVTLEKLGSGSVPDFTDIVLRGFSSVSASLATAISSGDGLGNHTATQDLDLSGNDIINIGEVTGSSLDISGTSTLSGQVTFGPITQDSSENSALMVNGSNQLRYRNLGSGAFLNTAAIADGGTGLATADQIHTFVTDFGYTTNTGTVDTSGTPVDNDFAKFTDANTIEGRNYSEVKSDLGLNNVTNESKSTMFSSPTFTGTTTIANGAGVVLSNWTTSDTDIDGLLPGSTFGALIEGAENGHITVGIRGNDSSDSFSILSGGGNYMTDSTYDTLVLQAQANGNVILKKLFITTTDTNTSSTSALVLNGTEVEKRTLGSGAFLNTAAIADGGTGLATADQIHTFVTGLGYTSNTGTVDTSGTPADNQIAIFTDSNTVEGNSNLTYNGELVVGTNISGSGLLNIQGTGTSKFDSHLQAHCLGIGTTPSGTSGEIRAAGDVTAYYSSDRRLKDNITNISNPLAKLSNINGVEFDWIPTEGIHSNEGHDIGVIAQEIEQILPEVVTTRPNGYKAVRYEKIVALLIEAVKDQQSQIEELKSRL